MRSAPLCIALALALAGCGTSTGIVPVGPELYAVREMRAPVLGGGQEAQRVAMGEASAYCQGMGRVFTPVLLRPAGSPYTPYYPTAFDVTFRCMPPR